MTKIERLKNELDGAISSNNFELAFQVINDMLDMEPEDVQHWISKGVILSKLDRSEESISSFDRGLEIDPNEAKLWYSKGCVLMDGAEHRLALACFYKSLDLDPSLEKARDRFIRCLDDWMADGGPSSEEEDDAIDEEGTSDDADDDDGEAEWSEEEVITVKEEEDESAPQPSKITEEMIKKKEMTGTFLDEDLFSEEEDLRRSETVGEPEEDWTDDGEVWDGEETSDEEEEPKVARKTIPCKCGAQITIFTDERPLRFECTSCGRTGTLKG